MSNPPSPKKNRPAGMQHATPSPRLANACVLAANCCYSSGSFATRTTLPSFSFFFILFATR